MHSLVTAQIPLNGAFHNDDPGVHVGFYLATLAYRQLVALMRDAALDSAFYDEIFV